MFSSSKKDVKSAERQMQMFEIEMMQHVFSNMTNSCLKKCIPAKYSDGDLTKGEAVCLDRCAAKFMQAYMHATKKLSTMTVPEAAASQLATAAQS
ncbi:hypothetical protein CRM22_008413 [Opisthorchis felineus]|uniref:Mitochondrial import inner membrane translocase subunit n=1 Tax=Opisthorchis felineus TaxID=147828 RepID=A0A4S2LBB8_OPIFE|nr:hypothetical protein CRM22_008413 [Opisthorchis felineus]